MTTPVTVEVPTVGEWRAAMRRAGIDWIADPRLRYLPTARRPHWLYVWATPNDELDAGGIVYIGSSAQPRSRWRIAESTELFADWMAATGARPVAGYTSTWPVHDTARSGWQDEWAEFYEMCATKGIDVGGNYVEELAIRIATFLGCGPIANTEHRSLLERDRGLQRTARWCTR